MEEDAIQTDVSSEVEAKPVLSEREQAMLAIQQEIATRYDEPKEEEKPAVAEEAPAAVATPQTVRVKVDGEEKDMPIEDVVKGYQKDSVASKRLEEAALKQHDLAKREEALAERERQIALASLPSPQEDEGDDDEITAAINALVEGDNEAAAKFLKDAVKKGRQPATPAPKAEDIAAQVKATVDAERQRDEQARAFKEFAAANPVFAEPEPDDEGRVILTKERVRGDYLFDTLYAPMFAAGKISYREALDKTAEHVAKEFAPVTPPPPVNERAEAKKKIDNIPVATGARPAQTVKERTAEDALNDMRKWRGQPTI